MPLKIKSFKEYEIYSQLKIPKNIPFFIRCDGRGFHKLTSRVPFEKPFDRKFMEIMVCAAKEVFKQGFNPCLAYVFSDEINFLFYKEDIFNLRLEKIVSIIPSIISSKFSLELFKRLGKEFTIAFDARIIPIPFSEITEYLAWRQAECFRNCINSYAYHTLISKGLSPSSASDFLKGKKAKELIEIIERSIDFNKVPLWHKHGVLIYWEKVAKEGFNPISNEKVLVLRRRLKENWNLPRFTSEEGMKLIEAILFSS